MAEQEENLDKNRKLGRPDDTETLLHTDLRRRAEKALEEGADEFRIFSEQVLMGVLILQDNLIKFCNQAFLEIIEYSHYEIMKLGPEEYGKMIHPDLREFALEQARKKQAGETDVVPEYVNKLISKSGRIKWVDLFSKTITYNGRNADLVTMVDITPQKLAEEALQEREQQFRNLIEIMNDGFAILDENCMVTYVNSRMCDMLMLPRVEVVGRAIESFLEFGDIEEFKGYCGSNDPEVKVAFEIPWKKSDGTTMHSFVSISPILDVKGRSIGDIAIVTDITDRKQSEEAIRKSEARYRELFDNAMEGIVVVDEYETVVFCNEAFASIFELESARRAIGKNMLEFLDEEQRSILIEQSRQRRERKASRYELNITTARGNSRTILASVSPRFDSGGEFVGSFGTILDISERKQVESELRRSRDVLDMRVKERTIELAEANRQLKKSIFDLYNIFELSRNFNTLLEYNSLLDSYMLASMGRMGSNHGVLYIRKEIDLPVFDLVRVRGEIANLEQAIEIDIDGPFYRHLTSLNRPVHVKEIAEKYGGRENLDFVGIFPHGLAIPLVYQTRLRGLMILSGRRDDQTYHGSDLEFLAILANQTVVSIENARLYEAEKSAQIELQKAHELLTRAERSAALGELSAKVAHEINNPLGIIKNYLLLMMRSEGDDNKITEYIDIVRGELDRIAQIVRQLLDFHRPLVAKFVRINPKRILDETLALMKFQLDESGIKVFVSACDNIPEIKVWPDGLKQVFMNLLVNARDAIGSGGEIYIRIEEGDEGVTIYIEDNGPGIPEDLQPHIFESFYTTKIETGGTGLGLSICKRIIKNHNGSITFSNTERGGCFRINLPIEQKEKEYDWRI